MEHLHMLTVLVRNKPGVLQRITGLFSRRGYSIQTIYAEQTKNPAVSRIILEVPGSDAVVSQVEKQLTKLVDVQSVSRVAGETALRAEDPVLSYKESHAVSEITLLDTTLRDGAQGEGIYFSTADKLHIIKSLDKIGIPFIEVSSPGSDPEDDVFFEELKALPLRYAQIVAFGQVRAPGAKGKEDQGIAALLKAGTKTVSLAGKAHKGHVSGLLHTTSEENLAMIADSVACLKEQGKTVIFDAEHFFDGYKHDSAYALEVLQTAERAGASCIVLCDSDGGAFPDEVYQIVGEAISHLRVQLGVHCHNDMGCGVANALMAVKAGASHVQGTFTGFGERCGNTNLSAVIGSLQLKKQLHCIPKENMKHLTATALAVSDIANLPLDRNAPYVGRNAFAHKGGKQVDLFAKETSYMEHIDPAAVGNKRNILLSVMNGREAVMEKITGILPNLRPDGADADLLFALLRERETEGYQYEAASASLELAVLRELGDLEPFFTIADFKVIGEGAEDCPETLSTAVVKVESGGQSEITAGEGEGTVLAFDLALRKAVGKFYPAATSIRLTDYKVRLIESKDATAAKVRVMVEFTDGDTAWTTVGVSRDIIRASLDALLDAVTYKLLKDKRAEELQEEE